MEQLVALLQEVLVMLGEMVEVDLAPVCEVFTIVIKRSLGHVNAWLFIFEILKSLVLGVIKCLESSEEIALYLIVIFDDDYSFALEIVDLVLDDLVVLQVLNTRVVFENCVDGLHVWETNRMLLFDVLGNEIWLFVVVVLNEEAHVCDGNSWCSSNSRGAMHVNCVVLNVDQVVKFDDSL